MKTGQAAPVQARLAKEIESLKHPVCLPRNLGEVACFELMRESQQRNSSDAQSGTAVQNSVAGCYVVTGEPFWAATEIVTNAELLDRTDDFMSSAAAAGVPA